MSEGKHTAGPWDYVASSEYHGPYVTTEFGVTVCDFYVMSNPTAYSVRNGGDSKPILHLAEMADANARLTAAAPDMLMAGVELGAAATDYAKLIQVEHFPADDAAVHRAYERLRLALDAHRAALSKATGSEK